MVISVLFYFFLLPRDCKIVQFYVFYTEHEVNCGLIILLCLKVITVATFIQPYKSAAPHSEQLEANVKYTVEAFLCRNQTPLLTGEAIITTSICDKK